jgi:GAF domain-containing protein
VVDARKNFHDFDPASSSNVASSSSSSSSSSLYGTDDDDEDIGNPVIGSTDSHALSLTAVAAAASNSALASSSSSSSSSSSTSSSALAAKKELVCVVSKDEKFKGARIAWGAGIVGHVALIGRSLNIADAYADPRFDSSADKRTGFTTKCILTVPVHDRDGSVVAVIQVHILLFIVVHCCHKIFSLEKSDPHMFVHYFAMIFSFIIFIRR